MDVDVNLSYKSYDCNISVSAHAAKCQTNAKNDKHVVYTYVWTQNKKNRKKTKLIKTIIATHRKNEEKP